LPDRQAFYQRIAPHALTPLWEVMDALVTPEPRIDAKPHLWHYSDVRRFMMEAGMLLTAEEATRRVLVLENPAFSGQSRATATLFAGVQMVLPGEIAPAHRHTQSALRFVLEGEQGYTAVGGERTTMHPGDFIITPPWAFHDHGNEGKAPVLWVDVLDAPIVSFFDTSFAERSNEKQQELHRPEGDAAARFGAGLLPLHGERRYGLTAPVFNYPYERTRSALLIAARGAAPDPYDAVSLRYANPQDGGWAMPTIATWMMHVPAGYKTRPLRSTDGIVVVVAEGQGVVRVGDHFMGFGARDVLALPNWSWRCFEAKTDCFLFCASDRGVQEKLGYWREERASI
jgi:gentisate 1,2-dioxygenase